MLLLFLFNANHLDFKKMIGFDFFVFSDVFAFPFPEMWCYVFQLKKIRIKGLHIPTGPYTQQLAVKANTSRPSGPGFDF